MVDFDAHTQWFEMMREKFLPFVRDNKFVDLVFTRVLSNETEEGFTYSLQVHLSDMEHYNRFIATIMEEYIAISSSIFGEKVLYFTSLLKKIEV